MIDRHLMILTSLAKDAHRYRPSCSGCGKAIPPPLAHRARSQKKNLRCSCGLLREWSSFTA